MVVPISRPTVCMAVWPLKPPVVRVADRETPMLWPQRFSIRWQSLYRALRYAPAVVLAFALTASLPLVF